MRLTRNPQGISLTVGTAGSASMRAFAVTVIARIASPLICGVEIDDAATVQSTRPPLRSWNALPLNGTCSMSMFAVALTMIRHGNWITVEMKA